MELIPFNQKLSPKQTFDIAKVGDRYDFVKEFARIYWLIKNNILLTKQGDYYKLSSVRNYKVNLTRLLKFCQDTKRETVWCDEVDFDFFEEFRMYHTEKGYTKNGVNCIMSNIRAIAKRLYREGKVKSYGEGVVSPGELVTAVALSLDELRILRNMDLTETPGHERVRDLFILQCFMGLRLSDMFDFLRNPALFARDRSGGLFIEFKTKKTGEVVWIPIAASVRDIFNKYENQSTNLSYQYYNTDIKKVIKESPIERITTFSRTEGGVRVDRKLNLSQMVSSHTARRTFATNAYLSGLDPMDIMRVTGHKTYQSFMKYIRCDSLQVAEKICSHDFFQKNYMAA